MKKSNYIIEWRYFIASIASRSPNDKEFFEAAKKDEQSTIEFDLMRLSARLREIKWIIRKAFK